MINNILNTHIYLIKELTKREIQARYKGSYLGIFWAFLTPIAMLFVFSFVFGEIFQAKWPGNENASPVSFPINLFIGLSVFWFFSDLLTRAPIIFSSVPNHVKKVVFPLGILPVVSLLSAMFHFSIYLFIIFLSLIFSGMDVSIHILYLIPIILVTLPMLLGLSFFLGSAGVYVRDISAIIGVVVQMLMFLSPVFYPLSAIPKHLQWVFELNPLTTIIESSRMVLLKGENPHFETLGLYFMISLLLYILGYKVFQLTRKGFADVL